MGDKFHKPLSERALDISLDDYIKESGLYISQMLKTKNEKKGRELISYDDQDTFKIDNDYLPLSEKDEEMEEKEYNKSENLEKINVFCASNRVTNEFKANSPNWRLVAPNISHQNRPVGMPPLVPTDVFAEEMNNLKRKKPHILRKKINGPIETHQSSVYTSSYAGRQGNIRKHYQKKDWPYVFNPNARNFKNDLRHSLIKNSLCKMANRSVSVRDISIKAKETNDILIRDAKQHYPFDAPLPVNAKLSSLTSKNICSIDSMTEKKPLINNLALASAGMVCNNLSIPQIATKLLDIFGGGTKKTPESKYNMKIQKEIHALQNKPLIYRCPEGEVISSDGPGLRNVVMQPTSTGVTLNQRFS